MNLFLRFAVACFVAGGALLPAVAGAAEAKHWLTGSALEQQLKRPVSVTWSQISLRRALRSLARSQNVSILLDRRIDPSQQLDLSLADEPLETVFQQIAQRQSIGVSHLGPVTYFGPKTTADRLRTVASMRRDEARAMPPALRQRLLQARAWHWDTLATPRELLAALADESGVKLNGLAAIPHDLWPAADLPPLAWVDRLSLLAAEFGLTFEFEPSGNALRLVPIPDKVSIRRSYRTGGRSQELAQRWREQLPQAAVRAEGDQVTVEGRLEDLEFAARSLDNKPDKQTTVASRKQVYELSIEKLPLRSVLKYLEKNLNLEIEYDQPAIDRADISLDQLVSFKVKGASLEQLLSAALSPAGLSFRLNERHVRIVPAAGKAKP